MRGRSPIHRAPVWACMLLAALALGLTACGGGGEEEAEVPLPPPSTSGVPEDGRIPGTIVWAGNFETGDLEQWRNEDGDYSGAQTVSDDRIQVVDDPVDEGRYAARVEVRQGDEWLGSGGNRAELRHFTGENEGDEKWYGWSTMFADDYPATDGYQIFTQWHATEGGTQPPVIFDVSDEEIQLRTVESDADGNPSDSVTHWSVPLERGVWHRFAAHVKWSSDPDVGFIELWYDGEQVLPPTRVATLIPGYANYLKQGLYRDDAIEPTAVLYHDGMTVSDVR